MRLRIGYECSFIVGYLTVVSGALAVVYFSNAELHTVSCLQLGVREALATVILFYIRKALRLRTLK